MVQRCHHVMSAKWPRVTSFNQFPWTQPPHRLQLCSCMQELTRMVLKVKLHAHTQRWNQPVTVTKLWLSNIVNNEKCQVWLSFSPNTQNYLFIFPCVLKRVVTSRKKWEAIAFNQKNGAGHDKNHHLSNIWYATIPMLHFQHLYYFCY